MSFLNNFFGISLLIACLVLQTISAQHLQIIDGETQSPLEGAIIADDIKSIQRATDSLGQVSLVGLENIRPLLIRFYGYEDQYLEESLNPKDTVTVFLFPQQELLEEIILSVARSESSRKKIAEQVAVISKKDIQLEQPATGADMLTVSPGVRVQKSQAGGGSPVLRGFEANRVLLVVDGVRLNNAIYRTGHLQNAITVNPHNIERVEVIFGSSSVGYGSDALGGVVHYYTKSPLVNSNEKFKSSFSTHFQSANWGSTNNATTELSFKKWASLTSLSYSNFGDLRMGKRRQHGYEQWGLNPIYSDNTNAYYNSSAVVNDNPNVQKNTAYSQFDLLQKFVVQLPKQKQLLINLQYSTSSDIDRFDKLAEIQNEKLSYAQWYYGPQKRFLFSPQFKFFPEKNLMKKGRLVLAYQNVKESRINRRFTSLNKVFQEETVNLLSLNGDFDFNLGPKHHFSYGFEGTYNNVYSLAYQRELILQGNTISDYGYRYANPSRYPSAGSYYATLAAYGNWIWDINDKLSLNAGLRLTYTDMKANWKETNNINSLLSEAKLNSEALTETIALIYRPRKNLQWNMLFSSGFRSPNIDDIGKIRESKGILVVPNSFLKPEYAYNFDIGLIRGNSKQKVYFSLRGFTTLISRHITRSEYTIFADKSTEDLNTILYNGNEVITISNKNLGNRFLYGGTFESEVELRSDLSIHSHFTLTKGDQNSPYGPLPSILPFFGASSLNFSNAKWNLRAEWNFNSAKRPVNFSLGGEDGLEETPFLGDFGSDLLNYAGSPAWHVFNLRGSHQFSQKTVLNFELHNILDVHYRPFASGLSAPGRSLNLGLKVDL